MVGGVVCLYPTMMFFFERLNNMGIFKKKMSCAIMSAMILHNNNWSVFMMLILRHISLYLKRAKILRKSSQSICAWFLNYWSKLQFWVLSYVSRSPKQCFAWWWTWTKKLQRTYFLSKKLSKKNISVNCTNIQALKSLQSNMGRAKKTLHTLPFGWIGEK